MIIAVNTRLLLKDKLEGIGWFTYETLKRITKQHPEIRFIFIFDRAFSEEFIFSDNVTPIAVGPQARHPYLWRYWFERTVPKILKEHKADLFLSPDGYLSLSTDVPSVNVIHDLNFEHHPKDIPFLSRNYYKKYFPRFAQNAKRIATVSEFSKKDIINTYGISGDKIDVVYNGANEQYAPCGDEIKKTTKNNYSQGCDYFLYVGALHPRKNVARLLLAFDEFKKSTSSPIKLLIVGEMMWKNKMLQDTFAQMKFKNEVIFTGRLNSEQLKDVLGAALALTYIPYFEGFGIPIVEAMYSGVPIITSNITSMPEIAGDAALLVDPHSTGSVKEAMLQIVKDEKLRKELILKGQIRKKEFTWNKTSELLWKCMITAVRFPDK